MAKGWKSGGRQAGTPNKVTADIRALAQVYGAEAIETLAHLMRHGESDAIQLAAIAQLLDRAYGKPVQGLLEADAEPEERFHTVRMTIVEPKHGIEYDRLPNGEEGPSRPIGSSDEDREHQIQGSPRLINGTANGGSH